MLRAEVLSLLDTTSVEPAVKQTYLNRLKKAQLTRDEKSNSHFCAYFLPFNPKTKQVFLIHHKKSGKWLSPGGHVDVGEDLLSCLNREIFEELGIKNFFKVYPKPFLLTLTPIRRRQIYCRMHYDIWHLIKTDGHNFRLDPDEFLGSHWLSITEAIKLTTDPANQKALKYLQNSYN